MTDAIATIRHRLQLAADVTLAMKEHHTPAVAAAAELIATTFRAGGKLPPRGPRDTTETMRQ